MSDPRLPYRRKYSYIVDLGDGATTIYPADKYRVSLEFGALIVYLRQVQTICDGDNDIPVKMYGAGAWRRCETELQPV